MSDSEDDKPLYKRVAPKAPTPIQTPVKIETHDQAFPQKPTNSSADGSKVANVKRSNDRPVKRNVKQEADQDNTPLAKKRKQSNGTTVKKESKPVKKETLADTTSAAASLKRSVSSTTSQKATTAKKAKTAEPAVKETKKSKKAKEEEEEEVYRWWEEDSQKAEDGDDSIKWTTLEHNGVLFPPEYVPHGVKMKYDGKPITLTPEAEEVASFFAALLETDHAKNPTFQKNFFRDWQEVLKQDPRNPEIKEFDKCDFRPIWEKFELDKEKKKQATKEEKQKAKEERMKTEEPFLYAYVDGRKEKVGNFRIEPPSLFRGRGDHPKTGTLKKRVTPEQVTINIGHTAKVPEPPAGHKWALVAHDQTATWLATWKENVNGSFKYVFLAASSAWKGQSDMQKFEKARELKKYVKKIRENYTAELRDKLSETRQRATAMYLIDRFALRAGNEKGDDEADTVGCCSLRYEHVDLIPPNTLKFDFLGKDSIRYENSVDVDIQVFKNIKIFKKQVGPGHMIFDRLTTVGLNKYLNSCMKGLSAKVFRTYNASHTFQQQLDKLTVPTDPISDKMLSYNRANREVAVLCNHQRTIRALKYQNMKLKRQILTLEPALKKKKPELSAEDPDLTEEWMIEYEANLVEKEREKIKQKFEKQNEKLKADGEKPLPESELKERLKAANEMEARLKKERKTGKVACKPTMNVEKLKAAIEKTDAKIKMTIVQETDKEENKEIALSTSKMNYIDPRISVAWCKKYNVPLEKVFSKTLIEKFRWAQNIDDSWKF
ncbi:hypothetical protein PHYBLDRAFT_182020 [Phycomyces blakesleeanus NRRL 1555(-)]|uniref:DNA topoisomerase I n=1 Tax=Phycomyces blakesleeanus (strain ATCC 8743b / DSM 1359 / FGSC 10004 / NBRC 33097 / NRRL 1555) TaxID=763407 RepID=A0A163A6W9_PHYB8|nr:hypothetical protein PHYBLDRAFT_182020 [Phycomyces blakesleeanus NRRL 1555(-)]OAD71481.1 hypothetical protein PHYBLDRAFT_182020 [Phycomyces blakesleeanus NRRL 1555(-)]|eukprot:XP_018289521.1 hypothetical protein PHYBLDRAFT_182020 [Phycomyces blakesleeanus NRRL 1555(-)]